MTKPDDRAAVRTLTTVETARRLSLAVRSVQLMVDRGELSAWKTPGGHRRIDLASIERWEAEHGLQPRPPVAATAPAATAPPASQGLAGRDAAAPATGQARRPKVLLIEDSVHFQRLVGLLVEDALPQVDLHMASDGIVGLIEYGRLQPDVLLIDILLPGIDGPTLVAALRSQPTVAPSHIIVVTSLDETERRPYAYALKDIPVVHKSMLAAELPPLLERVLASGMPARQG